MMAPRLSSRVASVDIVRGLIVALMALDHTRMYFTAAHFDPVDVNETTLGYFLTRWVTHLCAPGFFFLAGLGVALAESAGQSARQSTVLLMTRGAWLIALELTVIGFAWSFNLGWSWFGVIWSLGLSMICLGLLRWAPKLVLLAVAISFTTLHNLLPLTAIFENESVRSALYSAGFVEADAIGRKLVLFPLLPWLSIMILGYAAAPWLAPNGRPSVGKFLLVGAGAVGLFVALRMLGIGEPPEGGVQDYATPAQDVMSFLNVEKYPPSLQFSLATLGVLAVFVAGVEALGDKARRAFYPLLVFGSVPFFFYVLHLYLIHGLAFVTANALSWSTDYLFWRNPWPNLDPPEGYGFGLAGVWAVWILVLAILLPLCIAFWKYKRASRAWWTKYI